MYLTIICCNDNVNKYFGDVIHTRPEINFMAQIFSPLFTLKQMLEFLRQTIDRRYQVAHQVYQPLV